MRMAAELYPRGFGSPEADPVAMLDALAATAPAKARQGLAMAIGDLVEMTSDWPRERIAALDAGLAGDALPTLGEMRARFSNAVQRPRRRGRIKDEVEYHAVRNAAEMAGEEAEAHWRLLADYEASTTR